MAEDSLAQRIEAVEQRLMRLQEHARAKPEQQSLLAGAVQNLALALDGLRAARDEPIGRAVSLVPGRGEG